jgi:hypothetical protein
VADGASLVLLAAGVAAAFLVDIAAFALARRARPQARRGAAHGIAALAAAAAFATFFAAAPALPGGLLLPGLAMVLSNAYVGFHLDNMGETARRIRILRELLEAPAGLSRAEIVAAYPPQEAFARRIERLKLAGQCIEQDGRLRLASRSYSLMGALVAGAARIVFGPGGAARL